jgi:hypothetical protein
MKRGPDEQLISRKTGQVLLVTMGLAIAVPMLWRGQPMQRNQYRTQADCERDYAAARCEPDDTYYGRYHGPWYAEDPAKRQPGDAGRHEGRRSALADSGGYVGVEHGVKGGFGSTGRVRSIGG